jgi:Tfp pilus assembly protein PilV
MIPGGLKIFIWLRKTNEKGLTLLEVCFAISILSIGLLAMASMQVSSINGNNTSSHVTEGTALAADRLEKLLALPYNDAALSAGTHSDPSPPAGYTVDWNVTDNSPYNGTKTIILTVTWDIHGAPKNVTMQRIVAKII